MRKQKIKKNIFQKEFYNSYVTWKDIKHVSFEDDDNILVEWIEGQGQGEDNEGYFYVRIDRMVEETDEECKNRHIQFEKEQEERKQNRYEHYLKLKEEFER